VDDGLAGGAMMRAAIDAIRTQFPARVFLVVPVCARETCTALAAHVDRVVCLSEPIPFERLPVYYRSFPEVTDAEVQGLLRSCLNFTRGATDGARRNLSADALLTWKRGWELDL
jgi:predicted phosphoribosyltransferase